MGLTDLKFKETDFTNKKISDLSDTPSSDGMTAEQLKAYFDYMPKAMIALGAINKIIDELCSTSGAGDVGASVTGVTGINVQAVLDALKGMIDNRYTKEAVDGLLEGKASESTVSSMIASVDFEAETGTFIFTEQGGTVHEFDTAIEKVVTNWDYDEEAQKLVLTLESGETKSIDLSAFVTINEFLDSNTIAFSVSGAKVSASIKAGSVTDEMLESSLLSAVKAYAESCAEDASQAETAKTNAGSYADAAALSAASASNSASEALASKNAASASASSAASANTAAQSAKEAAEAAQTAAETARDQAQEIAGRDYATKTELNSKISKVTSPTAGNIPTLTTDGQIQDSGKKVSDFENAVKYTTQTLTSSQKTQARTNIGAGTSNFSGSYNDLTDKPDGPEGAFIAEYDSTTFEELQEAFAAQKPVYCYSTVSAEPLSESPNCCYRLVTIDETRGAIFMGFQDYTTLWVEMLLCDASSTWSSYFACLMPAPMQDDSTDGYIMMVDGSTWIITEPPFGETGADGYTPVRGTDYWTDADKAEIVQSVIDAMGGTILGGVGGDNIITLTGTLANGTYTLKYQNADGSLTDIGTLTISNGGDTPTYTNLVPSATEFIANSTTIWNGVGYMDGKYLSSASPYYGADAETVCTGLIPATPSSVFYIKGVTLDTAKTHCRVGVFNINAAGNLSCTAVKQISSISDIGTLTTLGDQYYKLTLESANEGTKYFALSGLGTGTSLIISTTEIE